MSLAKRIEATSHTADKKKKREDWFVRSAKALDIELDNDLYPFFLLKLSNSYLTAVVNEVFTIESL